MEESRDGEKNQSQGEVSPLCNALPTAVQVLVGLALIGESKSDGPKSCTDVSLRAISMMPVLLIPNFRESS